MHFFIGELNTEEQEFKYGKGKTEFTQLVSFWVTQGFLEGELTADKVTAMCVWRGMSLKWRPLESKA